MKFAAIEWLLKRYTHFLLVFQLCVLNFLIHYAQVSKDMVKLWTLWDCFSLFLSRSLRMISYDNSWPNQRPYIAKFDVLNMYLGSGYNSSEHNSMNRSYHWQYLLKTINLLLIVTQYQSGRLTIMILACMVNHVLSFDTSLFIIIFQNTCFEGNPSYVWQTMETDGMVQNYL